MLYECTPDGHLGFGGQAGLPAGEFLFPRDLQVTPTGITRVLLVGSCLTELYHRTYAQAIPEVAFDYVLFNSASDLPASPPQPVASYDFQYLQIPLRTVLTDRIITGGRIFDPAFLDQTYRDGCIMIDAMLEAGLAYNRAHGLLTFVSTFVVPQLDIAASLDRRSADGDIAFLIRRLNHYIAQAIKPYRNVFLCDVRRGRLQPRQALLPRRHHRLLRPRLQLPAGRGRPGALGPDRAGAAPQHLLRIAPARIPAGGLRAGGGDLPHGPADGPGQGGDLRPRQYAVARPHRRGFPSRPLPWPRGGWQNGIWEAVQHLRARGILVAVCSKNDHHIVEAHWDNVVDPRS